MKITILILFLISLNFNFFAQDRDSQKQKSLFIEAGYGSRNMSDSDLSELMISKPKAFFIGISNSRDGLFIGLIDKYVDLQR